MIDVEASDLLRIASTGWGYVERRRIGGPDGNGWELRASGGFTGRANSAWPLGGPGLRLADVAADIDGWYAERGLPAQIAVIAGSDLDREAERLGYPNAKTPALRQTAPLAPAHEILEATAPAGHVAEITTDIPQAFLNLYTRPGSDGRDASTVLTTGGADVRFAVIRDPAGDLVACGRLGMMRDVGWANIAALRTAVHARRRGLSRAVLRDLIAVAAEQGIENLYLEVEPDNAEARPFYTSLGFETNHVYHYRTM
jgi:N-acetylglutamate synthase